MTEEPRLRARPPDPFQLVLPASMPTATASVPASQVLSLPPAGPVLRSSFSPHRRSLNLVIRLLIALL